MEINKINTLYVFRDDYKMDCPENLISYVCLDGDTDLNKWFEENLKKINDKCFCQFLYENGSVIRAHSAKEGFLKLIRFWRFYNGYEFNGKVVLHFFYCTKRGLGSRHISFREFTDILLSDEIRKGEFHKVFRSYGDSKHPDFPKEPNIISDLRIEMNKDLQVKLIDKIPDFHLGRLKIKPYELCLETAGELFNYLISTKEDMLSHLENLLGKISNPKSTESSYLHINFRNEKNEELKGEVIYFKCRMCNYREFNYISFLDFNLADFRASTEVNFNSVEELVDFIFVIPHFDKSLINNLVKVKEVESKKPKSRSNSKKQLVKSFDQAELDKLDGFIKFNENKLTRFEFEDVWLDICQISDSIWSIDFYYPSKEEPIYLFKKQNINILKGFELYFWEANQVCQFKFSPNEIEKHLLVKFAGEILKKFLNVDEFSLLEVREENL